jgi:hypothetical protein
MEVLLESYGQLSTSRENFLSSLLLFQLLQTYSLHMVSLVSPVSLQLFHFRPQH